MSKFSFVGPYGDDPTVGHLSTPITTSMITRTLLGNLPAYRVGLSSLLRGLEVGMAHGYFLIGPFYILGPLRNSENALLIGLVSAIGLIIILTLGLTSGASWAKLEFISSSKPVFFPKIPLNLKKINPAIIARSIISMYSKL